MVGPILEICMKKTLFAVLASVLTSCAPECGFSFHQDRMELSLAYPRLPTVWREALGEAVWVVEWYGPDGKRRRAEQPRTIEVPVGSAVPIAAYPYWPRSGLPAGLARPAGAVFPFQVENSEAVLTWEGGVAVAYFQAMLDADGQDRYHPALFDWPRFSALLSDPALNEAFRADPWTADWKSVGLKTRASGFDRRRLLPEDRDPVTLQAPAAGPWVAASPFADAVARTGDGLLSVAAGDCPDALLSPSGYLRFRRGLSGWFPADRLVPLDRFRYTAFGEREASCDRAYIR